MSTVVGTLLLGVSTIVLRKSGASRYIISLFNWIPILTSLGKPLKNERMKIPKSRYDSVDMYLSQDWINRPEYNDTVSPIDEDIYKRLRAAGMFGLRFIIAQRPDYTDHGAGLDDLLSKHVSHLFIRDPLVIFSETIDQDDAASSDHFEVRLVPLAFVLYRSSDWMYHPEHSINKLADCSIQTSATQFAYWLARRVPQHGGTDDRLRECSVFSVRGSSHARDIGFQLELLRSHLQGKIYQVLPQSPLAH